MYLQQKVRPIHFPEGNINPLKIDLDKFLENKIENIKSSDLIGEKMKTKCN